MQKATQSPFKVTVKSLFVPEQSSPDQGYYFFAYRVSIENLGSESAQLLSRHWIITDGFGHVEEVQGPGVVGQQPKIAAGQKFEYESSCPLMSPTGSMKGRYQMKSDSGEEFWIEIPEFYLLSPMGLH